MNDYDANGKKIGHSSPSFFGGMNHYDNNGHKVGESRPGFFGGLNHYDDKGHKRGHSNPGFLGGCQKVVYRQTASRDNYRLAKKCRLRKQGK